MAVARGSTRLGASKASACVDELAPAVGEDLQRALRKALGALTEVQEACTATPDQGTAWGCKDLSDLCNQLFALGAMAMEACLHTSQSRCVEESKWLTQNMMSLWEAAEEQHRFTPVQAMVTDRLVALRDEVFGTPAEQAVATDVPPALASALRATEALRTWVPGYIWRETHWIWLMDSLAARRVVHTTWGEPEEWQSKFGVHDCHAHAPLTGHPPRYLFNDQLGMRWQIFPRLLRELRDRRAREGGEDQAAPHLLVVEVGVFAGHLSDFVLKGCDFVQLLGVDPYVGSDGTFPGNFSETLDADVALYKAMTVFEPFSSRAQLWQGTSEEAVKGIEDGSVDAVFVDGCHLYDCVSRDLELWIPKMRRGVETLVAGHDFSPQWPGVVQAVHEHRRGGLDVNLASDWMYWWFERYS